MHVQYINTNLFLCQTNVSMSNFSRIGRVGGVKIIVLSTACMLVYMQLRIIYALKCFLGSFCKCDGLLMSVLLMFCWLMLQQFSHSISPMEDNKQYLDYISIPIWARLRFSEGLS